MLQPRVYFKGLIDLTVPVNLEENETQQARDVYIHAVNGLENALYQHDTLHVFGVFLYRKGRSVGRLAEQYIADVIRKNTSNSIVGVFTYSRLNSDRTYETYIKFYTQGDKLTPIYELLMETLREVQTEGMVSRVGIEAPVRKKESWSIRYVLGDIRAKTLWIGSKAHLRDRQCYRIKYYDTSQPYYGERDFSTNDVSRQAKSWIEKVFLYFKKLFSH